MNKSYKSNILKSLILVVSFLSILLAGLAYADDKDNAEFKDAYGKYQEAVKERKVKKMLKFAKRAYVSGENIFDEQSEGLAKLNYNVANALFQAGEAEAADLAYSETLDKYKIVYGEASEQVMLLYIDIARGQLIYKKRDIRTRNINAKNYIDKALELAEALHSKSSMEYAGILFVGAMLLNTLETRISFSAEYLDEAYKTYVALEGSTSVSAGMAAYHIGEEYLKGKRSVPEGEDSIAKAKEYLEIALKNFPENKTGLSQWRSNTNKALDAVVEKLENRKEGIKYCDTSEKKYSSEGGLETADPYIDFEYLPIVRVEPIYPIKLASKGIEGVAIVEFDVDLSGTPQNLEVIGGDNHLLFTNAAVKAVAKWHFKPLCGKNGPTGKKGVKTTLTFNLR